MVFIDNTTTLGAVAKGSSSSLSLNLTCRKISGVLLEHNISQLAHWIPSALNPADELSSRFQDVSQEGSLVRYQNNVSNSVRVNLSLQLCRLHDPGSQCAQILELV